MFSSVIVARPSVSKVEPPNWWAGHSINPVRLMIRGKGFKAGNRGTTVFAKDSRLRVDKLKINDAGTYLFVDVTIPASLPPGNYPLEVSTSHGKRTIPFSVATLGTHPTEQSANRISNKDVIYQIMTDRFANGNIANDRPSSSTPRSNSRSNPRGWHGGDIEGVRQQLPYIQELGVTVIWVTPWYDNADNENTCSPPLCPSTNYDGYSVSDYYGVENHLGNMADLRMLVRDARKVGIKVIQDQISNHVGFSHPWKKAPPLRTWFSVYQQNALNSSVSLSPNRNQREYENLTRGWISELAPDLNHNEPEVTRYLIQNSLWWIEMSGVSGVRHGKTQYMPRRFVRNLNEAILRQYPNLWMVGDIFTADTAQTAFFQGGRNGWDGVDTKLPAVFDFALWDTSRKVFTGAKPASSLREIKKYDGIYADVNNVVVPINNHQTSRFMSLNNANEDSARLHTAFVLAARGIPQLYYGEEILMSGGSEPLNRKDFPGGWTGDSSNKFSSIGRTFKEQFMFEWTQKWIRLRRDYEAIQTGKTVDLHYDNNVYMFARKTPANNAKPSWVVFAFNKSRDNQKVSIDFKSKLGIPTTGCFKPLILEDNVQNVLGISGSDSKKGFCPGDYKTRNVNLARKSASAFLVSTN